MMSTPLFALLLSVACSPPISPRLACPSCRQALQEKSYRRHLAFCAPDLLDPEGWAAGDCAVVQRHCSRLHRPGSATARALELRFGFGGKPAVTSQQRLAAEMGWTNRRTRDTIAKFLHAIPPVSEPSDRLQVLYEDASMLVVNKPAGVGVTPEHRWRGGSVLNWVMWHLSRDAAPPQDGRGRGGGGGQRRRGRGGRGGRRTPAPAPEPRPCHRLDLNTSGALVFAKTPEAASALMSQFESRRVRKAYAALCTAPPGESLVEGEICRVDGVAGRAERRRPRSAPLHTPAL